MKFPKEVKIGLCLFSVFMVQIGYSQNLLDNASFTSCKSGVSSCSPGGDEGAFHKVDDWYDFGTGFHFGGFSSGADWATDIVSGLGTIYVAGIFENEGIYYDIGAGGFKTGIYHLSFYTKGDGENSSAGGDPVNGVSVSLCTVPPSPGNCAVFAGGDEFLVYKEATPAGSDYTKIDIDFKIYNGVVPYRYLVFNTFRDGTCDRYMFFAAPDLEMHCCGDYMLYQDCNYLPNVTQRTDFILAGTDVGSFWQPQGPVVATADRNVTFQARYVILDPGFSTQVYTNFQALTGGCAVTFPESDMHFEERYRNNSAVFTCDASTSNAFFNITGASYYRARVFNRWGEKIYDDIEWINELYEEYWNGLSTYTSDFSAEPTVLLQFYNCSMDTLDAFSMWYEYDVSGGCSPTYKKELTENNFLIDTQKVYDIYPNPANHLIMIASSKVFINNIEVSVYDPTGKVVLRVKTNTFGFSTDKIALDISNLSSGFYYLKLNDSETSHIYKIVVLK
ncbi:MAG: hypothetical protein JWO06_2230 [Bacteroidota bacterium]|nr:hypothetical protein [Bacteroidota bacterium]